MCPFHAGLVPRSADLSRSQAYTWEIVMWCALSNPAFPTPRFLLLAVWKIGGQSLDRFLTWYVICATYVTRLFVYLSDTWLGGVYTATLLFCHLPAVLPRMRERTVLQMYEGGDKVNFTSNACFLLVLLLPGRLRLVSFPDARSFLAGEHLVAWCNFLVTNTFPIWNLKGRMKSQKKAIRIYTYMTSRNHWHQRSVIQGRSYCALVVLQALVAYLVVPVEVAGAYFSPSLNHGRSKWMSDTLYSNFVAWQVKVSHCPLAWHRITPCILCFVYWKGL